MTVELDPLGVMWTPRSLQLQIVLACALVALLAGVGVLLWFRIGAQLRRRLRLPLLLLLGVSLAGLTTFSHFMGQDETSNLHAAWLMSQGKAPFADFWLHHSPLLWLVLAPVVSRMTPGPQVLDLARVLSLGLGLVSAGIAVWMAGRLHRTPEVKLYAAALCLSIAPVAELYNLRPDLPANVCSLAAAAVLLGSRASWRVGLSGALLGLAVAFTPKHMPLCLALPAVVLSERAGLFAVIRTTLTHWTGVAVGFAPLLAWLYHRGLLGEFWYWVFKFNSERSLHLGGPLPLVTTALVVAWALRRRATDWSKLEPYERLFMAFLGTSAAILLVLPAIKLVYYLQMYLFLACAAGALEAKRCCEAFCERGRYLALGALVSTAFLPHMPIHLYWLIRGDYKEAREEISALLLAAGNESVVAVSPAHPIFVHDLTYLSHGHQWNHCMGAPGVRERLSGMSRQVIQARPPLVLASMDPLPPSSLAAMPASHLVAEGVMTASEGKELQELLHREYRLVQFGRHYFWLRNDRPVPTAAKVLVAPDLVGDRPGHGHVEPPGR